MDMTTVPFPPVKFGISKFKDQGHQELAELSETVENEHFAEATTSHILRHWNYKTHKMHSVTRRIRSKRLLKSVLWKELISHTLFAESQAFKYLMKLHQCTS